MAINELVNQWSTHGQCSWCTSTRRYSLQRNYSTLEAWSGMYPWFNKDKGSEGGCWSGKCERGNAYGKATGLYNNHWEYSEQCNPRNPFQSAHDFWQGQSFGQQMQMWMIRHLRSWLDNFTIESFQLADALPALPSELDFRLNKDSWIEDHSHVFGTLLYRDIFKCIQLHLAQHPGLVHLDIEQVCIAEWECRRI